jgi:hypothetical protein
MAVERPVESFDDVRTLGEAELRALLESGRPEQRVWAIWELALRSTDISALGNRDEPDPGVRRNLAVVLAGHGQLELLVALAKRDPSPVVRAAAMQLVARFAIEDKLPVELVIERIEADVPEVRVAVLGTIFTDAPEWLLEAARKRLEDQDADVRYEAFEALTRANDMPPALMWLEEAPEAEARLALMRWSARGRVRPCAEALAGASRRLRRILVESVRVASWHELAPAVGDEGVLVRALARRNPQVFDQMPIGALVKLALREPSPAWTTLIRDRLVRLETPDEDVVPLLPDFRELCARQIAEIDAALANLRGLRDADREDQVDALEDQRVLLESALEQASRMLVH